MRANRSGWEGVEIWVIGLGHITPISSPHAYGRRQAKGGVIRYHLQFLKWQKPHKDWCTMQYNNG